MGLSVITVISPDVPEERQQRRSWVDQQSYNWISFRTIKSVAH
jgi:hypothetical protein